MNTSHSRRVVLAGLALLGGLLVLTWAFNPAEPGRSAIPYATGTAAAADAKAGPSDHPMFGGTPSRNMVNLTDKNIPDKFEAEGKDVLLWKADLGSKAYGGPTIAGGRVYVGTNNARPRNPRDTKKTA